MKVNKFPHNTGLPAEFLKFYKRLMHERIDSSQRQLIRQRINVLNRARKLPDGLPYWLSKQDAHGPWKIGLPDWCKDQRNQMTGPADDAELVVKLMNSGSPGVMLDLEDSMANTPENLLVGYNNIKKALYGELTYKKNGKTFGIKRSDTVVWTRVRGLHLNQIYPNQRRLENTTSASLFDLAYLFYDLDLSKLAHPPCIYIPKSESASEARWWKNAFRRIEKLRRWPQGTIKCMALVESHPMAYEMEEFAYQLQPYLVGLNLGRWDYMASLIDYMYNRPGWLFPDRNSIPTDVPFFQNLRSWMAHVCHKHGLLAIGGMTALYPNRRNKTQNKKALKVLKLDKENEARCLMDGAWTGHPDQNSIALEAFPYPNQLDKMPGLTKLPDLREFNNNLDVTEEGTREAIRTCIQYRQGVLNGKGASLINGYMEDLATDRIYRIMIAQRIDREVHTVDDVARFFREENDELGYDNYIDGCNATWNLIQARQFNPK